VETPGFLYDQYRKNSKKRSLQSARSSLEIGVESENASYPKAVSSLFDAVKVRRGDDTCNDRPTSITVEDKDPGILWLARTDLMFIRFCIQLTKSGRWAIFKVSDSDLLRYYRWTFNKHLPKSCQVLDTRLAMHMMPYMYPTVKGKCYLSDGWFGAVHVCKKPNHSCLRCISSSVKFTGKDRIQPAARALQFWINNVWKYGFSTGRDPKWFQKLTETKTKRGMEMFVLRRFDV